MSPTTIKPKSMAKVERPRDWLVVTWSSWFGLGLLPIAPGTWGTFGAFPIWWALSGASVGVWIIATVAVALFAIWISILAEPLYPGHDASAIVIDEVAGMLVCAMFIPFTLTSAIVGFLVFRLFDIFKPPPVRWLDDNIGGGTGVVVDDLAAGVYGLAVMHGIGVLLGGW